jgi:hypothetical protein
MTTTPNTVTVQATPFPIPSAIEQALVAGDIAGLKACLKTSSLARDLG